MARKLMFRDQAVTVCDTHPQHIQRHQRLRTCLRRVTPSVVSRSLILQLLDCFHPFGVALPTSLP